MSDYSTDELIACFVSRQVPREGSAFVGAALPALRAGTLLGHMLHAPNLRMLISMTTTNLHEVDEIGEFSFMTDWRAARWAEHYRVVEDIFSGMRRIARWQGFYVGALQIDPHGNSNLIGIRGADGGFKVRGAGSVGTPSVTAVASSFRLVVNRHDARTFVEECDYVSCPGWLDATPGARERLGLRGGPEQVITPLAILGFDDNRRLRVDSVHRDVTLEDVQAQTGFGIAASPDLHQTPPPTDEELGVLRTRVDPRGTLRKERHG